MSMKEELIEKIVETAKEFKKSRSGIRGTAPGGG